VLCATLSGSGHEMFRNLDVEFETVIIDEAAQCVELSALIPLKYGCCKCILVGDPKQLPPTVLSQSAARFGYDQSLFVRMQQNHPKSVHLLDMQYRMHPEISMFPSKEFYEAQLKDGQDMAQLRQQPWHASSLLGPYRFFDVQGVQERGHRGQSLVNTKELEVAMQIYERFSRDYEDLDLSRKIGIITPYKAQLYELRNRFRSRYGEGITDIIEFNTTDAFQGRECEIIIFSCVRASSTGGIGFMTDIRRMNVGLTRAKSSLWILGDSRALVQGEFWKKLIDDAQARDRYTKGDILSMFRKPLDRVRGAPAIARLSNDSGSSTPGQQSDGDVVMLDNPPSTQLSNAHRPLTKPADVGTSFPSPSTGPNKLNGLPYVGSRDFGPPVIHTSTGKPPTVDSKKRPLDDADPSPGGGKRIAPNGPRQGQGHGLMGKFGQKANKPFKGPKPPTDPAALSVLGLVPPERPPPVPSPNSNPYPGHATMNSAMRSNGSTSSDPAGGRGAPGGPPRPPIAPSGPRKKGKPSLFVPRRR
jgi:senataxin